ncbi:TonB-dependent receptor [Phenylobacterium montanum]|uniref:TonB-dependent receptor n=1 Tax=Phenylobacterium montanum TaxID=2823693 RepID=A0A975G4B2_9CAUL|nr:TonB-dependent receptor [Caulobacter sp. S6]QUD90396.1 TonB-dependent receptor [Caulobacter sp. S6]
MNSLQPAARRRAKTMLLLASCAAAALAVAPQVRAAAAADAAAAPNSLEEVIVTARKKDENIQNVPVAVTALPAKVLDRYALTSVEKIAATTPELKVVRGNSGSGADISLRGVGTSFTSVGLEQSVAVDVDGVYYGQGRVINEALFDMKQVEVLKGPQALFFGKNATAGVISFTTADPTPTLTGMLRASYEFTANQPTIEGYLSGPITDRLSVRLAIQYSDMLGGYVKNLAPATTYTTLDVSNGFAASVHNVPAPTRDAPQEKDLVGRFTAKYRVSDALTDTVKATLDQYRVVDATWNSLTFFCPLGARQTDPGEPCGKNYNVYQNPLPPEIARTNSIAGRHGGQLYQDYDSEAVSNDLKYEGSKLSLDWVTGFHHFINYFLGDYDLTGAVNAPAGTWGIEKSEYQAFSTELRGQTKFAGPVNLMGGFLYQSTQLNFNQFVIFPGGLSDLSLHTNDEYATVEKRSRTNGQTWSGFGQVIWDIAHDWNFTAGARYTHETKDSYFIQPYVVAPYQGVFRQYDPTNPASFIGANQSFDNTAPEAALTWKPRSNLTLYAAYKTGYKSGGFSGSALNSAIANTTEKELAFKPETVKGFEGGVKSTLLNGALRLNADAYDYTYDNFQVDFFDSVHIDYVTKNVGKLETRGFEVQADWAPEQVQGLLINGALAYNNAFYKSFPDAPCYGGETIAEGCSLEANTHSSSFGQLVQNLTGVTAGQAPMWTGTLGVNYERDLPGNLKFGVSGNAQFSSSYHLSQFGYAFDHQAAYATFDASLRLGDQKGRWEVALIGKNLTDQFILTSGLDVPSTGSGTGTANGVHSDLGGTPMLPRTIALQFTTRF